MTPDPHPARRPPQPCCSRSSSSCRCSTCSSAARLFNAVHGLHPGLRLLRHPGDQRARQRPAALPRAHREDPVGHHGLRLRHEPRAGAAAAARPAALRRSAAPSWCFYPGRSSSPSRRSPRSCASRRLRRRPGGARDQPLVLVARLAASARCAAALVGAAAVLDHAVQPLTALAMGVDRRRGRHARRVRDEGARSATPACAAGRGRPSVTRRGRACSTASRRSASRRRCSSTRCAGTSSRRRSAARPVQFQWRMRLGIDPGLRTTGFGVVECRRRAPALRRQRHDPAPTRRRSADLPARLKIIFDGVREVTRALRADLRLDRDRVRQRQSAVDAAARPGARRRADRRWSSRDLDGQRVHRAADEEGDRRPRPGARRSRCRQMVDAPARPARPAGQGRRRCARPRRSATPTPAAVAAPPSAGATTLAATQPRPLSQGEAIY